MDRIAGVVIRDLLEIAEEDHISFHSPETLDLSSAESLDLNEGKGAVIMEFNEGAALSFALAGVIVGDVFHFRVAGRSRSGCRCR